MAKASDLFVNPRKGSVMCRKKGGGSIRLKVGQKVPVEDLDEHSVKTFQQRGNFVSYDRLHQADLWIPEGSMQVSQQTGDPTKDIKEAQRTTKPATKPGVRADLSPGAKSANAMSMAELKGMSVEDLNRLAAERGYQGEPFSNTMSAALWLNKNFTEERQGKGE